MLNEPLIQRPLFRQDGNVSPDEIGILHIETSSFVPPRGEPSDLVEISIAWSLQDTILPVVFSWLLRPSNRITVECMTKHNITNDMVCNCPSAEECSHALEVYLERSGIRYLFAENMSEVRGVMERTFPWFSPMFPQENCLDLTRLARHLFPDFPRHDIQYLRHALGGVNVSRWVPPNHVEIGVLRYLASFARKMAEEAGKLAPSIEEMSERLNRRFPVKVFLFGKHKGQKVSDIVKKDPLFCEWLLSCAWMVIDEPDLHWTLACLQSGKGIDEIQSEFLL